MFINVLPWNDRRYNFKTRGVYIEPSKTRSLPPSAKKTPLPGDERIEF